MGEEESSICVLRIGVGIDEFMMRSVISYPFINAILGNMVY